VKTLSFGIVILGLVVSLAFLLTGAFFAVPWNTLCVVLFGLGVAYAGLCGWTNGGPQEEAISLDRREL
jgi:hypothetical protein